MHRTLGATCVSECVAAGRAHKCSTRRNTGGGLLSVKASWLGARVPSILLPPARAEGQSVAIARSLSSEWRAASGSPD